MIIKICLHCAALQLVRALEHWKKKTFFGFCLLSHVTEIKNPEGISSSEGGEEKRELFTKNCSKPSGTNSNKFYGFKPQSTFLYFFIPFHFIHIWSMNVDDFDIWQSIQFRYALYAANDSATGNRIK